IANGSRPYYLIYNMPMKRYSNKEPQVFLLVLLPYIFFFNWLIFGSCMFTSFSIFARLLAFSCVYLFLVYFVFGLAAMLIQKRFPDAGDMFRRIAIMLPMFYVMNSIALSLWIFVSKEWQMDP